jgi:hypothetical protein
MAITPTLGNGAAIAAVVLTLAGAVRAQQPDEPIRVMPNQQARMEARLTKAFAIVERLSGEANQRGLASGWRQASLDILLPLSLETLQKLELRAVSIDSLAAAALELRDEGSDPSVLGSTDRDLVYTPITPCRFIDTRNVGGKISGVRSFNLMTSGSTYGGSAACGLSSSPAAPAAIAMNVTVVDTAVSGAPGFLAVKPAANAPLTSLLNWHEAGPAVQVANQAIVSTNQAPGSVGSFVIETSGAVEVIVDIFGAFRPPRQTALETIVVSNNVAIGSGQTLAGVSPVCPSSFVLTGGGCVANADFMNLRASVQAGTAWICTYFNQNVAASFTVQAICARVPGR